MSFFYKGIIPASKSLMNRALICKSYDGKLKLLGDSQCDDVLMMKKAIEEFDPSKTNIIYNCGAAGTTLRFLALRLSRIPGRHVLKGTKRLMQRPQQDLLDVLKRLGVQSSTTDDSLILESKGWQNLNQPVQVQRSVSSQFASSLILNAWDLETDLTLETLGHPISEGYLEMTLKVVKNLGMQIEERQTNQGTSYRILKQSSVITETPYHVESDLSSAFAIAAYAALNGEALFERFPHPSLQPDAEFVSILQKMGVNIELLPPHSQSESPFYQLKIKKSSHFQGIEYPLQSCPDLFPVLAVLCAFAQTPSRLYDAPQLIHKESNRIAKISELLNQLNVSHEVKPDGMIIKPSPMIHQKINPFAYDTDHDHRLAFAAALVQSQAIPIEILHPDVVTKSFPEFWDLLK